MATTATNPLTVSVNEAVDQIDLLSSAIRKLLQGAGAQSKKIADVLKGNPDAEIRIKRIQAESDLQRLLAIVAESDKLVRADLAMKEHPGMWKSATHYIKNQQTEGEIARRKSHTVWSRKSKLFMALQESSPKTSAEQREYDVKRLVREEGWGLDEARDFVEQDRNLKAAELRRKRRSAQTKAEYWGRRAFNEDVAYLGMDDRERFIHDRQRRYGGGDTGRERARKVWEKQLFGEFKWLKPLAKNSSFINKHLPTIAKGLKGASGVPILGKFIKHPALAVGSLIATTYLASLKWQSDYARRGAQSWRSGVNPEFAKGAADLLAPLGGSERSVAEPIHKWRSATGRMFHGGGTEHLSLLARYGIAPIGKNGLMNGEEMLTAVLGRIREFAQSGRMDEAISLADEIGIDPSLFFLASGGYKSGKSGKTLMFGGKSILGLIKGQAYSTGGVESAYSISRGLDELGAVRLFGEKFKKGVIGITNPIDAALRPDYSGRALTEFTNAAISADEYSASGGGTQASSTTNNKTITISIGNMDVNADNAKDFINSMMSFASASERGAVMSALDPVYIA